VIVVKSILQYHEAARTSYQEALDNAHSPEGLEFAEFVGIEFVALERVDIPNKDRFFLIQIEGSPEYRIYNIPDIRQAARLTRVQAYWAHMQSKEAKTFTTKESHRAIRLLHDSCESHLDRKQDQ